jgi:hypothetical protein
LPYRCEAVYSTANGSSQITPCLSGYFLLFITSHRRLDALEHERFLVEFRFFVNTLELPSSNVTEILVVLYRLAIGCPGSPSAPQDSFRRASHDKLCKLESRRRGWPLKLLSNCRRRSPSRSQNFRRNAGIRARAASGSRRSAPRHAVHEPAEFAVDPGHGLCHS